MLNVNPEMEAVRAAAEESAQKDRAARCEAADGLIGQCEQCELPWQELSLDVQQRICRHVQLASGGLCFNRLAELLGVEPVDRRFYAEQSSGQLVSSTELMLEDVARRAEPPSTADVLRFLRQHGMLAVLADVSCGVQEACALRRQRLLHGRAGGSPMDSGYQGSVDSGADIVGVLTGPPDTTLVQDAPSPQRECETPLPKCEPPLSNDEKNSSKKIMLTYAADGRETARLLADQLKAARFRVMLLENQRHSRMRDPYSAVQKWFKGTDYIVPVLTAQYFAATQNRADVRGELARRLAEDARFVYTLMCAEMQTNGHINYRVRPVMPEGVENSLRNHPLYGSPLFRFPFGVNELNTLVECLEG